MLLFVDQQKNIKVFRVGTNPNKPSRVRLGVIQKNKLEMSEELRKNVDPSEVAEVDAVIARYRAIHPARTMLDALSFPQTVREVVDLVLLNGGTNGLERGLVMTALLEGLRKLRRADHVEAD